MPGFELIGKEEREQLNDIFDNGGGILFRHGFDSLRNGSYKVREFEEKFADRMDSQYALAVTSGTAALRVALAALGVGPGDEVITQSFTFVATVEAIIESGATPVCTEIDQSLNMDPEDLKQKITAQTKAVIAVHMLGTPADLESIGRICQEHNLTLIEDSAWGAGGYLKQTPLGAWGAMGTYSFDFAKTMTTGDGGMIVFQSELLYKRAAAWHDHGHENNPTVPRWEDTRSGSGFNFRMNELQGAVGLAQLEKLDAVVHAQRTNRDRVWQAIKHLPGIEPRAVPVGAFETADALVFFVSDNSTARRCREALLAEGLGTKILPEAITWHFAGTWDHMPQLVSAHDGDLDAAFVTSKKLLSRAVALPVTVVFDDSVPSRVAAALASVLK